MFDNVDLEILGELAPGAFHYGMTCVVEFEPHSLWHEVSLTIAAEAVKRGIKTEYHVFQYTPAEIRGEFRTIGLDVELSEESGLFRILDSYTPTTPMKESSRKSSRGLLSGRSPKLEEWHSAILEKIQQGFEESEKRWLHIDDNEAILLQYNDEEHLTNGWRTVFLSMAKARQLLTLHSLVAGIASESFYRKREARADAVIELKAKEERGRLEQYIRLRVLRGKKFDTQWRRIEVMENGLVRLSSGKQVFGFQAEQAERIFDLLARAFIDDVYGKQTPPEMSGWRSMVEIATGLGIPSTSLYSAKYSAPLAELFTKGLAERRVFPKQRGRGGSVTRLRVAYQKEFVREYLERCGK